MAGPSNDAPEPPAIGDILDVAQFWLAVTITVIGIPLSLILLFDGPTLDEEALREYSTDFGEGMFGRVIFFVVISVAPVVAGTLAALGQSILIDRKPPAWGKFLIATVAGYFIGILPGFMVFFLLSLLFAGQS